MIVIRYNQVLEPGVPKTKKNSIAEVFASLCYDGKKEISYPAVSVVELAQKILPVIEKNPSIRAYMDTPWPWDGNEQPVNIACFMEALAECGKPGIRVPVRQMLLKADKSMGDTDSLLCSFLAAYYCSFDDRFAAAFSPAGYSSYCGADAYEFLLSAQIARSVVKLNLASVSASSVWLSLLAQEPFPSLLYDFLDKTQKRIGVSHIGQETPEEETDMSTAEMCRMYSTELDAVPMNDTDIITEQTIELMVLDAMDVPRPVSIAEICAMIMAHNKDYTELLEPWTSYCAVAGDEVTSDATWKAYYPDTVTLSEETQEMLSGCLTSPDLRRVIGSAAFAQFLDAFLAGGAPDTITLSPRDIAIGAKMCGAKCGKHVAKAFNATKEDLEALRTSRKLGHFGVPMMFQRTLIASMVKAKRATVTIEDVLTVATPGQNSEPLMAIAPNVDPLQVHAGVEQSAASALSLAGLLYYRAKFSHPVYGDTALRIYSPLFASGAAIYRYQGDNEIDPADDWYLSMAKPAFDPRLVGFMPSIIDDQTEEEASYTIRRDIPMINKYGSDLVDLARRGIIGANIKGRENVIELIETVIARKDKSNPLLLAPAGAGKTAIVEAIAKRIADKDTVLCNMGLFSLDIASLMADGCSSAMMADRLKKVIAEAANANIILFIDEIHMLMDVGTRELNAANVLKPALARGNVHVIGATTEREYNYTIATDRALSRRFSVFHLPPLEFPQIVDIIDSKKEMYGEYHHISYKSGVAALIGHLAEDYMSNRESPDRELDILDTAASIAVAEKKDTVGEEELIRAVKLLTSNRSVKTRGEIAKELVTSDWSKEEVDAKFPKVAGQHQAKATILRQISEARLGITARRKPRSIFMFVGGSGVGKTHMAYQMAPLLDVTQKDVLTIALGDYIDRSGYTRLIGSAPTWVGYKEGGELTNFLISHPNGIVVLDEIDKCAPEILNLFLGLFDTGEIKSGAGHLVDCTSATFVCTANTGYGNDKVKTAGFCASSHEADKEHIMDSLKKSFGEPLLNRIDEIVLFNTLNTEELIDACTIAYKEFANNLEERYSVSLADKYDEEKLRTRAKELLDGKDSDDMDARTAWALLEKELRPIAISLLE